MAKTLSETQAILVDNFNTCSEEATRRIRDLKADILQDDPHTNYTHAGFLTPIEVIQIEATEHNPAHRLIIKREDLSVVNSFKIRGAYNKVKKLLDAGEEIEKLVAVSAGNHAQGVAYAANKLGKDAVIFMSKSAPRSKVEAVERLGGDRVTIKFVEGALKDAAHDANAYIEKHGYTMIHPYDDVDVIAGQSTIMTEVLDQLGQPVDLVFSQCGGGGMTAGVGMAAKQANPSCRIIAVEEENQACLSKAFEAGTPTELDDAPSTYCEGTSVPIIGALPFAYCQICIDDPVIKVSQGDVDAAGIDLRRYTHATIETSGSIGYAGYERFLEENPGAIPENANVLVITSGSNIDDSKLHVMTADPALKKHEKKYIKFQLDEENGNLLSLVQDIMPDINVSGFIYGKKNAVHAWPIIAFSAPEERLEKLEKAIQNFDIPYVILNEEEVKTEKLYRCEPALMKDSHFFKIEFREGSGSLRNLLEAIKDSAGLSFFDYEYSGDTRGTSEMAFETDDVKALTDLFDLTDGVTSYERITNPYLQMGLFSTLKQVPS